MQFTGAALIGQSPPRGNRSFKGAGGELLGDDAGTFGLTGSLNGKHFICMFPDTCDAQYLASFAADLENAHFKVIARAESATAGSMLGQRTCDSGSRQLPMTDDGSETKLETLGS